MREIVALLRAGSPVLLADGTTIEGDLNLRSDVVRCRFKTLCCLNGQQEDLETACKGFSHVPRRFSPTHAPFAASHLRGHFAGSIRAAPAASRNRSKPSP
jgi:hypothetical protein